MYYYVLTVKRLGLGRELLSTLCSDRKHVISRWELMYVIVVSLLRAMQSQIWLQIPSKSFETTAQLLSSKGSMTESAAPMVWKKHIYESSFNPYKK